MFNTESYTLIAALFPRLLGLIYFFAFVPFLFQIKGLIGNKGILPLSDYFGALKERYPYKCYLYAPSLFWLAQSNGMLMTITALGALFSLGLMLGIYPSLLLFLVYIFYLSIVSAGQDFLSFGWEGFLLEITAYAFLLSLTPVPNLWVWICINLLLFRFHFQAGAVKLQSHDSTWADFTALAYHYQTQPIPNTQAWYVHKFPLWFHKLSAGLMFAIELIVPFALFGTDGMRAVVFVLFFGLQFFIWITGNFSYLNHLTAIFSTILLSNYFLDSWISPPSTLSSPLWLEVVLSFIGIFFVGMQLIRLSHHFFPNHLFKKCLYWFSYFHLVNPYGIFAVMTTKRHEIIVEGSYDGVDWKEYSFPYKPSSVTRRPKRISPYQPRLDWQVWFLPFTNFYAERWFQHFLFHLLKGTPDVLKLLDENPFSGAPPAFIRVVLYDYVFSSFKEKKEEGRWWTRSYMGIYSPTISLKTPES
ncbi:hypothetical protein PNK_1097 [Candidatus Protochlamydia naegleriophila]|uniref:Lipase maturation factor family protein n=1 Tax=Candidatus Protochlamydia naegleriophila TaxID=389348 RepID=A0A0U5JD16_9BACT|nr:lipase maturation factor family protein [Candidatus Protochlamydia naegleriophila]CUI16714.1 hypothetical protein PNK_1097 [Candidatus Protochlamydia naegleriophila]